MKAVPLAFRGVLFGLLSSSLHAQDPVLATPGTATWQHQGIPTGTRTEFTLTGNTVLNWDQLHLESGSEMDFNFVGGDSVLNLLTGGKTHFINGAVTSNGNVAFVSPNAKLVVEGDITAESVTLSTQNIDSADFFDGGDKNFDAGGRTRLTVRGNITATKGDALFVGGNVEISPTGVVRAKGGSILYAAGRQGIEVSDRGAHRIEVAGQKGAVTHLGDTRAARIEISAGEEVTNSGVLGNSNGNGNGRVFVEVGEGGRISNEGSGIMYGVLTTKGAFVDSGIIITPDIDNPVSQIRAESTLKIPELKRPGGREVTSARTVTTTAPMSASSDAARQTKRQPDRVAKNDRSKSLLTRGGFFGVRGGGRKIASR